MQIIVKKPTEAEIKRFKTLPTWGCGVSEFSWTYSEKEVALLIEGEVEVRYGDNKKANFSAGDLVEFPKDLSCYWVVTKPVKKHFEFL